MPAHTPGGADELRLHLLVLRCQSGDERAFAHRFIRRVSFTAWTVTFLIAVVFTVLVGAQVAQMAKAARVGAVPWAAVFGVALPLIIGLGLLSLLVATLSTVGIFLRLRTASLAEIQLRLAVLEEMLAARGDSARG